MKSPLSTTSHRTGLRAPFRSSHLVVAGSLFVACGEEENQPPFATVDELPATRIMTEKSIQEYDVGDLFRDPDEDPLIITASIDDASVANVVVENSLLAIEGATGGETMVTLTAKDPHGGEAQVSGQLRVVEPVLFWRDDFDYDNSEWIYTRRVDPYEYRPGYLTARQSFGASREESVAALEWLVSASVAVEEPGQTIGVWSSAPSGATRLLKYAGLGEVDVFEPLGDAPKSNWQVMYFEVGHGYKLGGYGNAEAVAPIGEFSEMHWGVRLGVVEFFVGETLVWSEDAEGKWPLVHVRTGLSFFPANDGINQRGYFDWAELWAIDADFTEQ